MFTNQGNAKVVNEAVVNDAGNIFWQHAERQNAPPPPVIFEAMVSPPALKNTHGHAGEMLTNMGEALLIYVRGDAEDAINLASRTLHAIRNLASNIWEEKDEHGLPRECYGLTDGTTLAQCSITGEWEQLH